MFPIVYRGHSITSPDLTPKPAFQIYLRENRKAFYPGETVHGAVRFLAAHKLTGSATVQGILVKIKCEGEINHGTRSSEKFFKRTYFFKELYVYGNGKSTVEIPRKGSRYAFRFNLPPPAACPQTYVGLFGSVICEIEASLKANVSLPSQSQRINLYSTVDLNIVNPEAVKKPLEQVKTDSGIFSLFRLQRDAIHVYLIVSKGGFVPGELVLFRVEIDNASRKSISGTRIELIQKAKFMASSISKTSSKTVCQIEGPNLDQNFFQAWEGVIEVPDVPPTTAGDSVGCIKISYKLKFTVETGPMSIDVRAEVPLIIGTVPLLTSFSEQEKYRSYINLKEMNQSMPDSKATSISVELDLATSRRPSRSFSIHRLPDYVTAIDDVQLYPDSSDIPPPSYEDATVEDEPGNEN